MPKMTPGQKAHRVLDFLMGLRFPRVIAALTPYGFTQEALDEGWRLRRGLAGEKLATPAPADDDEEPYLEQLDAWENKWFVIAEAVLRRHHPAVADRVFLNLSRTSGAGVMVSVGVFLDRVAALATGSAEEKAAHALLSTRGLSPAVVGDAQKLIAALTTLRNPAAPVMDPAVRAAAEDEMWRWYLEWSSIARTVIRDGNLLRSLGFRRNRRRGSVDERENDDGEESADEPVAPSA